MFSKTTEKLRNLITETVKESVEHSVSKALAKNSNTNQAHEPKLKAGLIGCGGHGKKLSNEFARRYDCEISQVCDPDSAIGSKMAAHIEITTGKKPKYVKDLRDVFADKSIDFVIIATPHHWHALAAIWAMQAGKDVYLEKPLTHTFSEGKSIIAAAKKYNRVIQCGTQLRSQRSLLNAIKYIHDGKLGEVKLARCLSYKTRKPIGEAGIFEIPKTLDYDLWAGPSAMKPVTRKRFHYDWHWDWDFGNGGLGNNGVHRIDVARWGLNVSGLGDKVISFGGRFGKKDAGETPDTQVTVNMFGDKAIVHELRCLKTKPLAPFEKGDGTIFYGTKGIITYGLSTATLYDTKGKFVRKFTTKSSPFENHYGNFINAIKNRDSSKLNATAEESNYSAGLCHVGSISHRMGTKTSDSEILKKLAKIDCSDDLEKTFLRTRQHLSELDISDDFIFGQVLSIDASTESFIENDKANELLTRSYRKPYLVPLPEEV